MRYVTLTQSLFCLILLALSFTVNAQTNRPIETKVSLARDKGTAFDLLRPFAASATAEKEALKFAPQGQFLDLDLSQTKAIAAAKPEALTLEIPYNGTVLRAELVRNQLTTADFTVITSKSHGQPIQVAEGAHYQGILSGEKNSLVAVSFAPDGEVMAVFSSPKSDGNVVLGKLELPGNTRRYIVYNDHQLLANSPVVCHTPDKEDLKLGTGGSQAEVNGCVRVFLEADYELYQNKVTAGATLSYLQGVFNQVATLYTTETISTKLSQVFIWVSPDVYSTTSSSTALDQFRLLRTSFNGDIAHLTGLGGGNLGGIGYIDVLCFTGYNYSFSNIASSYSTVPTYSWTVECMTHELGHNLGSNHTHWCGWSGGALDNCYTTEGGCAAGPAPTNGGTVMSYCHLVAAGINFSNGFGTEPGNQIRSRVSTSTCLAASCTTTACPAPSILTVSNIAATSATISWGASSGASSYTLKYRTIINNQAWTTLTTTSTTTNLTGLITGEDYEVVVAALCATGYSDYLSGVLFTTTNTNTCSEPSTTSVSSIAATTATYSWGAISGVTYYGVSYKTTASGTWGAETTQTATSKALSGLTASTSYDVRVRSYCTSGWSANYNQSSFTTIAAVTCGVPAGFSATSITSYSARVNWGAVSGASTYTLQYKISTNSSWTSVTGITTAYKDLTGLAQTTTYSYRVLTVCSGGSSAYSATNSFTTATCTKPNTPTASAIAGTTATISWTAVAGALNYTLQYKKGTGSWTTVANIASTSYNLTGLTKSTAYTVQVRTNCSTSMSSAYSTTLSFTTAAAIGGNDGSKRSFDGGDESDDRTDAQPQVNMEEGIALAPNPASSYLTVALKLREETDLKIEILDLVGRPILSQVAEVQDGSVQFQISDLPKGLYVVRVATATEIKWTRRFTKI